MDPLGLGRRRQPWMRGGKTNLIFNGTTSNAPNFSIGDKVSVVVNLDGYSTNFTVSVVS